MVWLQSFIFQNKSPSIFTNIVLGISFIILIYILVQLIIILNKPTLLHYSYEDINIQRDHVQICMMMRTYITI